MGTDREGERRGRSRLMAVGGWTPLGRKVPKIKDRIMQEWEMADAREKFKN